jgi:ubiquinone/menaquinone biosynthesis C-methylase UbiE
VEELPYPSGYFDVVTSMGAMEHFIDDLSAMREIHRVLRTGGRYIVEMFMRTPLTERIRIKTSEFLYPRFRPRELARWALLRWHGPHEAGRPGAEAPPDDVDQPVMNFYTPRSARRVFERAGFRLARLITKRTVPNAPLPGHHYRIYVLEK